MKTSLSMLLSIGMLSAVALSSCQEDILSTDAEAYTQAFVDKYGIPQEGHSYNMASRAFVTVETSTPTDVLIVAEVSGKKYKFAEYYDISGSTKINFDIPSGIEDVYVYADGRLIPCKIGSTVNIDDANSGIVKVASRDGDPTWVEAEATGNAGWVKPENFRDFYVTFDNWHGSFVGWEALNYIEEAQNREDPDQEFAGWLGYGHMTLYWIYWEKPADEDFEVGFYLRNSNTYMPAYRTSAINGEVVTHPYRPNYNHNQHGIALTIDFDNETQEVHMPEWIGSNFFYKFYTELGKDKQLLADIEEHYQAYNQLVADNVWPKFEDYRDGNKTVDEDFYLPRYPGDSEPDRDERINNFWKYWDNFVYNYIQRYAPDAQKSKLHELNVIKQYLGNNDLVFTHAHSYPSYIEKIGDASTHVYKVTFELVMNNNGLENIVSRQDKLYEIIENNSYRPGCFTLNRDLPQNGVKSRDEGDESFSLYIKKGDDIYYTHKGATNKVPLISTGNHLTNGQGGGKGMIMLDIDNDKNYDDMILFWANSPVSRDPNDFEPFTWIMACEDLGSTDDWDFNDYVIGISYTANNLGAQTVTIRPLAAGGIYPIYLMYTDPDNQQTANVMGAEAHKWLGTGLTMYNTESTYLSEVEKVKALKYTWDVTAHGKEFSLVDLKDSHWSGNNMGGFWILVDKSGHYDDIIDSTITIKELSRVFDDVKTWTDITTINVPFHNRDSKNLAPMMILVGADWEWPAERKDIGEAYPGWDKWVKNASFKWYGTECAEDCKPVDALLTKRL